MEVGNRKVVLKQFITGIPKEADMEVVKQGDTILLQVPPQESPSAAAAAVLVKNLYLSCDPYMRGRMRECYDSYIPPFHPGSVIEGFGVSKVIDSTDPNFSKGDFVTGITGWEEYSLIRTTDKLRKISSTDIPLSYNLGLLGMPGFTAYAGFYEVCLPNKGDFVFVSAASGAVGQIVGQLAKLHGCYVVGSAGSKEKVDLLKNRLSFDEAFNYKEETDLEATLKRYFPQGIDIYFDNVGGSMLDAALANMRVHGRVAVCGMVSLQSLSDPQEMRNLNTIIKNRVNIKGFLQSDYLHLFPKFLDCVEAYYKEGKIVYIEDMSEGLESAPGALVGLFSGRNLGKQVVCIAKE